MRSSSVMRKYSILLQFNIFTHRVAHRWTRSVQQLILRCKDLLYGMFSVFFRRDLGILSVDYSLILATTFFWRELCRGGGGY